MSNNFQIKSLAENEFQEIFQMDYIALEEIDALRMTADKPGKYPCRVTLTDTAVGEEVILLNYPYHEIKSPYRATGPIFVKVNSVRAKLAVNEIPVFLEHRFLSLRAYNKDGMMKEALTTEGKDLQAVLRKMFDNPENSYIHIHNARQGCYLCVAERK
jgi:hypothetical protein